MMDSFWEGLGIALIILSIGGCNMMVERGDGECIKARAEAKLMEAQAKQIEAGLSNGNTN